MSVKSPKFALLGVVVPPVEEDDESVCPRFSMLQPSSANGAAHAKATTQTVARLDDARDR